jgi:hypothetical protein
MIKDLNLTLNQHKASLYYIRTLQNHEKIKYSNGFNGFVARTN